MDLEQRIARLEPESQIRQLIARYCFSVDDRQRDEIAALFADDAVVRSADGVMNATGVDAIMRQFEDRFDALGPGAHYTHDLRLDFIGDGAEIATGVVSAHAELERNGRMMVAGIRYIDRYRKTTHGWRFAERTIGFLYYVPIDQYPGILLHRDRNRAYAESKSADFPEGVPGWARGGQASAIRDAAMTQESGFSLRTR